MKVLVPVHAFNNFGGIVNHTEQLIAGLKDLGHEVTFTFLKPTAQAPKKVEIPTDLEDGYSIGAGTGYPVHQGKGWICPSYSFLNKESIDKFVSMANQHDLIIWESIFGFKNKNSENNTDWMRMITDVTPKQVVIIHDGNLRKLYPWIYKLKSHLDGLACVHVSAEESAKVYDLPQRMILNPQEIGSSVDVNFTERKRQILSPQTFKRWKRVDQVVSAVPYIDGKIIIAGDGIERAYMCSVDKCKEEYYCTKKVDPDAADDLIGNRIWENAEKCGMEYLGFITEEKRDEILRESLFLIDPSWSKSYGEHFNRTVVDAMKTGTVPIAVNLGISDNEAGEGRLFKPNQNYLMLKCDYTPKQYGSMINKFLNIPQSVYEEIANRNFELIKQFDRKTIAQQYLDLAKGEGNTPSFAHPEFIKAANRQWETHFEPKEVSTLENFF